MSSLDFSIITFIIFPFFICSKSFGVKKSITIYPFFDTTPIPGTGSLLSILIFILDVPFFPFPPIYSVANPIIKSSLCFSTNKQEVPLSSN